MLALLSRILLALRSAFEVRAARQAEILVLRQQSLVLSRLVTPRDSSKPEARASSHVTQQRTPFHALYAHLDRVLRAWGQGISEDRRLTHLLERHCRVVLFVE